MKRIRCIYLILFIFLFSLLSRNAAAFYCNNKIVDVKATVGQVLLKCGEPQSRYAWTQGNSYYDNTTRNIKYGVKIVKSYHRSSHSTYEEWVYNFGPNQFLYILLFKNGKLIKINTDGYGFY